MTSTDEDALMQRLAAGETRAAAELARLLGPRAFAFAFRLTGRRSDAEDLSQEALLRLIRAAPRWDRERSNVRAWLFRVVLNLVRDSARRERGGPCLDAIPEQADDARPEDHRLHEFARKKALQSALNALPERQRQAVVMRYIEELSMAETAELLEISEDAVESLTARGRRALALLLKPRQDELGVMP